MAKLKTGLHDDVEPVMIYPEGDPRQFLPPRAEGYWLPGVGNAPMGGDGPSPEEKEQAVKEHVRKKRAPAGPAPMRFEALEVEGQMPPEESAPPRVEVAGRTPLMAEPEPEKSAPPRRPLSHVPGGAPSLQFDDSAVDEADRQAAMLSGVGIVSDQLHSAADKISGFKGGHDTSQLRALGQQGVSAARSKADRVRDYILQHRQQANADRSHQEGARQFDANLATRTAEAQKGRDHDLTMADKEAAVRKALLRAKGGGGQTSTGLKRPEQMKAMVEVQDRYNNIKEQIGQIKAQVEKSGTYDLTGPHNALLEQRLTSIATDMAKLVDPNSVARESEVEAFKKMLFSPSAWMQNKTALGVLDGFDQMVDQRIDNAYRVRGLEGSRLPGPNADRTTPTPVPTGQVQQAPRSDGLVTVRRKSDGTTKTLSAEAAQKYAGNPNFEIIGPAGTKPMDKGAAVEAGIERLVGMMD